MIYPALPLNTFHASCSDRIIIMILGSRKRTTKVLQNMQMKEKELENAKKVVQQFIVESTSVDTELQAKLMSSASYQVLCNDPEKPLKIYGIDPMSTPVAMAIVRLYNNYRK